MSATSRFARRMERYLGTVELTQDLTPLRALEGERRLLAIREFAGHQLDLKTEASDHRLSV